MNQLTVITHNLSSSILIKDILEKTFGSKSGFKIDFDSSTRLLVTLGQMTAGDVLQLSNICISNECDVID